LSSTSGSSVNASPTSSTTYTVAGTDANGCVSTSQSTVTYSLTPSALSVSQTPASVCTGNVASLSVTGGSLSFDATNYAVTVSSGVGLNSMTSPTGTLVAASVDDGASSLTNIGFSFNFAGTNYTQFWVNSNGVVGFNSSTFTSTTNTFTAATNYPILLPLYDDLGTYSGGITYKLTGTAPNRQLTIDFQSGACCGGTSASTIVFQVVLSETTNTIRYIYNTALASGLSASIGIASSSSKYISFTSSTNSYSSSVTNDSNAGSPASGSSFLFTPPTVNKVWSPTTNLYTDNAATIAYTGTNATTVYAFNPLPTITLGTANAVCLGTTSSSLSYTATTGSPNQYVIDYDATANAQGFVDITSYTNFSTSPISLSIPTNAASGTYNATITVKNSTTGCISSSYSFKITINAPVAITAQPSSSVS